MIRLLAIRKDKIMDDYKRHFMVIVFLMSVNEFQNWFEINHV